MEKLIDDIKKIEHGFKHIVETGDIILVAGKGHETYQIIGEEKLHFDDREVLKAVLEKYQ